VKGRHWKIENDGQVASDVHVIYVDDEGNETDVSTTIQRVEVDLSIGEVSRATLHTIFVETNGLQTKEAQAVIARLPRPTKWGRWKAAQVYKLKAWVARQLTPQLQREIAKQWKRDRGRA
jgi:hypothetical protein